MKSNSILALSIIVLSSLLLSCSKLVSDEFPWFNEVPVVNALLIAGDSIKVHVSLAEKIDSTNLTLLNDAQVILFSTNKGVDTLQNISQGLFKSRFIAESGLLYSVKVLIDGFDDVFGYDSVPSNVNVKISDHTNYYRYDEEGNFTEAVEIEFHDNPNTTDYYEVVLIKEEYSNLNVVYAYNDKSPIILNEGFEPYTTPSLVFSDQLMTDSIITIYFDFYQGLHIRGYENDSLVRILFTELLLGSVSYLAEGNDNIVTYGFYDLNGKISWRPDTKRSIHASLYAGDDLWAFTVLDDGDIIKFRNRWGNIMGSIVWKQILNPKFQINNTISFSRYRVRDLRAFYLDPYKGEFDEYLSNSLSSVKDITIKSDWKYRIVKSWSIDFGIQSSYLVFLPNLYWDSRDNPKDEKQNINSLESAGYIENQISLGKYFDLNIGVRGVHYITENFSKSSLEPRLDLSITPIANQTLNATYMKTNQFSQLVLSSGSFLTNEVWIPARMNIEPANAEHYSVGWRGAFFKNIINAEICIYKKQMNNLVAFKEGYSNLRGDVQWEKKIETGGVGNSRGIEFLLSKDKGDWTGFLSYTYSNASRQFDNINKGESFVFDYDRPHSFSIDIQKKVNKNWSANVLWVYQTGLPYTPAIGRYYAPYNAVDGIIYENEVLIYGDRNSERMRAYHRMDIGLKYFTESKKGRDVTWSFSIYNLYNRKNPYFYYYNSKPGLNFGTIENRSGFQKLYQFSYFPILPTVSYTVEF